jgi:hypothetical protein
MVKPIAAIKRTRPVLEPTIIVYLCTSSAKVPEFSGGRSLGLGDADVETLMKVFAVEPDEVKDDLGVPELDSDAMPLLPTLGNELN